MDNAVAVTREGRRTVSGLRRGDPHDARVDGDLELECGVLVSNLSSPVPLPRLTDHIRLEFRGKLAALAGHNQSLAKQDDQRTDHNEKRRGVNGGPTESRHLAQLNLGNAVKCFKEILCEMLKFRRLTPAM